MREGGEKGGETCSKQYLPQSWGGRIVLLTEENAKNDDGVPLLLAIETGVSERGMEGESE